MAGLEIQDPTDLIKEISEKQEKQEQEMLEEDFNEIQNQIKDNPEKINKISKDELETIEEFIKMEDNKEATFDMYIEIFETLQNPDDLWRRDKNSLNEIKDKIGNKYNEKEIWEYQMNKDVFNEDFDFNKLKKLWKNFQKWTTNDWFKNIPQDYEWENEGINQMCEGKLYTPKQLVDSLYKKNQDRREKIFDTLKNLNIENVLENDEELDIDELNKLIFDGSSVVGQNIMNKINEVTNIDGYREYQDVMNKLWENYFDDNDVYVKSLKNADEEEIEGVNNTTEVTQENTETVLKI